MFTTTCPTAEQLAHFGAGKLPLEDLNAVAHHLATCISCQVALEGIDARKDALVSELKQGQGEDPYTDESGCRRAVAQVEALVDVSAATQDMLVSRDTDDSLPTKTLGKYQLLEQIGQGGMGTVYKAVHTRLKRVVALKVLSPHRLSHPQAVSRFRREIEAAGRLDHAHIVRTSDADEADGQHFLVMEWLAGQDLAQYVRARGPLPVAQACDFICQAARGLDCAHRHGMVHRDVKPSNLLLTTTEDQRPLVKVLDLGLALIHDTAPTESEITSSGQVMGTYDYISPEQAMESHTVDARADIHSLGCTFYYLLTGHSPFQGRSEMKKLLAHQLEQPTPMTQYRSDVPEEVMAVVTRMMAKNPAHRFASAGELVQVLQALEKKCVHREQTSPEAVSRDAAPLTPTPLKVGPRPVPSRSAPPRRRPLVMAALLLLSGLFFGAWAFGPIRIPTEQGDYIIDTDDSDFAFRVSKGGVILEDRKTKREYHLKVLAQDRGRGTGTGRDRCGRGPLIQGEDLHHQAR